MAIVSGIRLLTTLDRSLFKKMSEDREEFNVHEVAELFGYSGRNCMSTLVAQGNFPSAAKVGTPGRGNPSVWTKQQILDEAYRRDKIHTIVANAQKEINKLLL
jgi:hypothetical protein